jgi:hypothetical protein
MGGMIGTAIAEIVEARHTSAQSGWSPEDWRADANAACGGDQGCVTHVLRVIGCESGGDPNAVGPNGELGILQVDPRYWGTMGPVEQIYFFLNPPAGAWWVCQ